MKYTFKPSHIVPATLFVVAVLYGGSKPPMPTNPPPDDVSSPTNAPMLLGFSPRPMMLPPPEPTTNHQQPTNQISNWTARGAYCDWERIEFRNGFAFPVGTNFIDSVMLMAYGEIKSNLHCSRRPSAISLRSIATSDFDFSLPSRVSLEPNVSSVTHGLTPSNSYLFAWHNCCVERCATNRVDASIELFRSGAVATTVTPLSTNQPPITIYQPPIPPEGFVGHGQDDAWLAASFPSHYDAITNLGYDAWLDGHIGHNEPNGRYRVDVTIAALPEHGPCYLFCGPYKMVVTQPGTYSFPLEVFEEYRAYTLPERVPLSFEYDDGYDVEEDAPLMMGAPLMAPRSVPDYYIICMTPHVYVVPQHIPLPLAVGTRLNLYCNCPNGTWSYTSYFENHLRLTFGFPSYAEIQTAEVADRVTVIMRVAGHECSGVFFIDPPPPHQCCNACCGDACFCDGTCCICNCGCHSDANSSTNSTEIGETP